MVCFWSGDTLFADDCAVQGDWLSPFRQFQTARSRLFRRTASGARAGCAYQRDRNIPLLRSGCPAGRVSGGAAEPDPRTGGTVPDRARCLRVHLSRQSPHAAFDPLEYRLRNQCRDLLPAADPRAFAGVSLTTSSRRRPGPWPPACCCGDRPYSALMPTNFITRAHFSVASEMIVPNSAGEHPSTVPPSSTIWDLILLSARPALSSLFSISMISAGVFLGAPIPAKPLASQPGTKSPTVGTSGNTSKRVAVVTARARSLSALMCWIDSDTGLKITCIWPPT